MNTLDHAVSPQQSIAHLQPEVWVKINTLFITKAICEFNHELLIKPEIIEALEEGWSRYVVASDDPIITYQFVAKPMALNHLRVDPSSIMKFIKEENIVLVGVLFVIEFR